MPKVVDRKRAIRAAVEGLESRVLLSTYLVTNNADSGAGSLRQAITDSNSSGNTSNEIDFSIGAGGQQVIMLQSPLPAITTPVNLNGRTQGGYAGVPLVQINGYGLSISAGNSTVQGLDIVSTNSGALITLARYGSNTIAGNYLGTDLTGTTAVGNAQYGIYNNDTPSNIIGGTAASQRNVISGSTALAHSSAAMGSAGIYIFGLDAKSNLVEGNYIGTNAAGTAPISNVIGIAIDNQATFNTIGGTTAGAGNVISGNSLDDVLIQNYARNNNVYGNIVGLNAAGNAAISSTTPFNTTGIDVEYSTGNIIGGSGAAGRNVIGGHINGIYFYGYFNYQGGYNSSVGNYIGTDVTGTFAVGNTYGIVVNSYYDTVGGTGASDRNIIAGNQVGVQIFEPQGFLEGNYIGLNAAGKPLGNYGNGVLLSAPGGTVGGAFAGAGNVISANGNGIVVTASGGTIQGNLIGTDPTGTTDMGNVASGIFVSSQTNTTIGGTTTLARNVIAANKVNGVRISGDATTTGNTVQGNYIGVNSSGGLLGNALAGVSIQGAAATTISGNTIAGNYGNGAEVIGTSATNDKITQNSIYGNVGIGIDLGGDGTTPNHVGGNVSGPDNLLNHPILSSLASTPSATTVSGTLNAAANSTFTLEFFATPYANGLTQGKAYLGKATATTDANGNATFSAPLAAMAAGQTVTATATDAAGDTSEFSPALGAASVVGRRIFYNNSAFDGNNTAINSADDQAIAADKQALLPGTTSSFSNYTSYSKGINGIMLDVASLAGTPTASDFTFLAGNTANPSQWSAAPAPASVQVRPGAGANGSTRIEITWADGAIRNQWLQISLNPTANTGLGRADVFYFGNLIGETGKAPVSGQFVVTSADMTSAKNDPHTFLNPAAVADVNDFNRDGRVDALDQLIARTEMNVSLPALQPAAVPMLAGAASISDQPAQTAAVYPTAQEQYMIQLINRARANPSAEAALDGINLNEGLAAGTIPSAPVQPLAINPALTQAAEQHSQWMLANQTVSHNEGAVTPATRMQTDGYVFNSPSGSAENLAFSATTGVLVPNPTTVQEEKNLFVDSSDPNRSHRLNLLNPNLVDVGVGISTGLYGQFNGMYATQDFAYSAGSGPYLTGVVFNDSRIHDNFYEPGEGLGNVTITATRASDGATFTTTTWAAGGYTLAIPAGTYAVTASGAGLSSPVTQQNVVVGSQNVEQDFNTSGPSYVAGRYVFYNASAFDGNNTATNAADDNAIAPDKQALLPGTPASFVNYTSYSSGINGIMVDLAGVPSGSALSAADFAFKVGTTGSSWSAAPAPTGFLARAGAGVGGSTRVEFTFANGAIKNEWLQITVTADANTGLSNPDVFYFGNAIAESGDNLANAKVETTDLLAARSDPHTFLNPAPITNVHDYNRDGRVDALDQLIARSNNGFSLTLFTPADPTASAIVSATSPVIGTSSGQGSQDSTLITPPAAARRRIVG